MPLCDCRNKLGLIVTISAGDKLWWAADSSAQLGTVTKRNGLNLTVLRNKTTGIVNMKMYDSNIQRGKTDY